MSERTRTPASARELWRHLNAERCFALPRLDGAAALDEKPRAQLASVCGRRRRCAEDAGKPVQRFDFVFGARGPRRRPVHGVGQLRILAYRFERLFLSMPTAP